MSEGLAPNCLDALIGLPLAVAHLAADMRTLGFGALRERPIGFGPRKGEMGLTGTHALHIQCSWRLRDRAGVVTGSDDLFVYGGDGDAPAGWHYEQGHSLQTIRMAQIVESHPTVLAAAVEPMTGDFRIDLTHELILEAFPTTNGTRFENWRFFAFDSEDDHTVSGSNL